MKRGLLAICLLTLCLCSLNASAFTVTGNISGGTGLPLRWVYAVPTTIDTFYVTVAMPFTNNYTHNLAAGGYLLFAYQDLNTSLLPDLDEPRGFYGGDLPQVFQVLDDTSGVNIEISPPNTGGFSGRISYNGSETGTTYIYAFYTPNFEEDTLHGGSILLVANGNGTYTAVVDSFTTYYAMAFMDVNGNFRPDSSDPHGVYGTTTPQAFNVQHTNFPDSINIVLLDPPSAAPERPAAVPQSLTLAAFPNPFNSATRVRFAVPRASAVRLALYDILGREVQILTNLDYVAGEHEVLLDGGMLPAGLYVLRLECAGTATSTKVLLLK